jgi:hypothetical protein
MNTSTSENPTSSGVRVSPAVIGCFVLGVSFFLPWIYVLGAGLTGFDIAKNFESWMWLWAVPALSVLAIVLGLSGKRHTEVAQVAGGLPIIALAAALIQNGGEVMRGIAPGGWFALIAGLFLVIVVPRLGRKPAASVSK